MEYAVIGAGIAGLTAARVIAENGDKVLIFEKRKTIGGNCHDLFKEGNYFQKFGPHIFHTNEEKVWNFLSEFTEWHDYKHKVYAKIDSKLVHIPFNFKSLKTIYPKEKAERIMKKLEDRLGTSKSISIMDLKNIDNPEIKELADFIYEKIFFNYTVKQWGYNPEELDKQVVGRVPVYLGEEEGYFRKDKFQGIPKKGFTYMFDNMLKHKNISIKFGNAITKKDLNGDFKSIIVTSPIDEFYSYKFGRIKYRKIFLNSEKRNTSSFQENSVINYPNEEKFTRITEYNKFLGIKNKDTIISKEYSSWSKGFLAYPIFNAENQKIIEKYLGLAKTESNIQALGRLAECKYYNIDQACSRGIEVAESLK